MGKKDRCMYRQYERLERFGAYFLPARLEAFRFGYFIVLGVVWSF